MPKKKTRSEDLDCNCQELALRLAKDDLLATSPDLQEFLACNVVSLIEIERALAHVASTQPEGSETRLSLAAIQIRTARLRVALDFVERGIFSNTPTHFDSSIGRHATLA
ncbi:MAG TPA: hypothetical protein VJU83_04375 [Burkholderiales bacterium]|nr:hypothetical protein [Burkholderiales bacterium]